MAVPRWIDVLIALAALVLTCAGNSATAGMPETIERVKASIVAVGTQQRTRSPQFAFRGTGFVVGNGTLVATNSHVIPESLQVEEFETVAVMIRGDAGQELVREAKTIAVDRDHDLALLRITGAPLPAMLLGNSDTVREGDAMAFTGFPIGNVLGFHPVTHRGMVSAITAVGIPSANAQQLDARVIRRVQAGGYNVFQLDAVAFPGNSGSPLYDVELGQVRGILNMVFIKGAKESALSQPTGISFAMPSNYLDALLRQAAYSVTDPATTTGKP